MIIQEKNEILKKKEKINIKRVFSVANTRLKSGAKNEIGEELFHRMNNMNENPLLFKIEN